MNEALKELVYTAMQNAVDNGHAFMQSTYIAIAVDLCDNDADLEKYEPEDLEPYVKQFCWQPEVDKVKTFISEGNIKDACDRVNMFLPDIQSHIYAELPIDMALVLAEYDRTDESYK